MPRTRVQEGLGNGFAACSKWWHAMHHKSAITRLTHYYKATTPEFVKESTLTAVDDARTMMDSIEQPDKPTERMHMNDTLRHLMNLMRQLLPEDRQEESNRHPTASAAHNL